MRDMIEFNIDLNKLEKLAMDNSNGELTSKPFYKLEKNHCLRMIIIALSLERKNKSCHANLVIVSKIIDNTVTNGLDP